MAVVDLEPAAERMAVLISDVPDEMLELRRPVPNTPSATCSTTSAA